MISCHGTTGGGRPVQENNRDRGRQEPHFQENTVGDEHNAKHQDRLILASLNINGLGLITNIIKQLEL